MRASQAIAGLSDPVVLYAEAPVEELRTEVMEGVRLLMSVDSSPATGQRGRPAAMTPDLVAQARHLHEVEKRSVPDVARVLGVSRATVYRYLK